METVGEPVVVNTLRLRRGEVTCVDTAGARLAGGGGDGSLRLWRWTPAVGWLEVAEHLKAHRYGVTGVSFTESGVLCASIGIDGAARIWSAWEELAPRSTLAAPDAAAARALLWASSERLVVGHDDGGVRVWAVRSAALLSHVRAHEGAVYALAVLDNIALLLTACTEGVLKVFEFEEIAASGIEGSAGPTPLLWEDGAHDMGVLCAAQCGRRAATGGRDGRVRVWRARGAGRARRAGAEGALAGHTAAVTALRWRRGLLASASLDRTARLWDAGAAVCIRVLLAHSRYLTCIAIGSDLRYVVTGSNDKSIRTWSLGSFSLDDTLDPECNPLAHFALGDLEGIGPVADDRASPEPGAELPCGAVERCAARATHAAAVNSMAVSDQMIAIGCSDGQILVYSYREESEHLELELQLSANSYPVLAVDFGAGGALLLSGGLDGCARLWDVQTGCELMAVPAESDGGGGVRDARLSPHRPPLLLLASDAGAAAVWTIDPPSPEPIHVYLGMAEAALCCAWSEDGRVLVTGGEAGELRLLSPPPRPALLSQQLYAHDLGVLSCDFANSSHKLESDDEKTVLLLATGGRDALVKLWRVTLSGGDAGPEEGSLELAHSIAAHGAAVQCVRWGRGPALATGGADRWARVWRVAERGAGPGARAVAAVPAGAAGGACAVRLLADGARAALAVGSLAGALAVWRVPVAAADDDEGAEPRLWGAAGVARWLREYVTRPPEWHNVAGSSVSAEEEARLLAAAAALSGGRLLDEPLQDLMSSFGYDAEPGADSPEPGEARERLLDEVLWLRREPLPDELQRAAPHALRCPLAHGVLREPARAADGVTYERRHFLDWLLAAGAEWPRSPLSGRRLASAQVRPNHGVRARLRALQGWRAGALASHTSNLLE